jgi:cyclophilin family peptidyl-prolyl cis-trans isomerase
MLWSEPVVTKHLKYTFLLAWALLLAGCATAAPSNPNSLLLFTNTPAPVTPATPAPLATTAGLPATPAGPVPTVSYKQWPAAPAMAIDPSKIYVATLKTAKGDIVVELLADKAPVTVNNFVFLAKQGFYDNTTFHRVIAGNFAQGGDPSASGTGGPGYSFSDEFNPTLRFEEPGLLAMANSGPDTNGSQFFITFIAEPQLTGLHTIFGKVIKGLDVAMGLTARDPQTNPTGPGDALISVQVTEAPQSQLLPPTATAVPSAPTPAPDRPIGKLDVAARQSLFNTPPAMVIDLSKTYSATIKTTQGDIVIDLFPADAPASVNNFVVLANLGYWDNFPIDFTNPGQFFLTGSPGGQPSSDIGYTLPAEVKRPNAAGAVGFWYRTDGFGSSGSEFYILLVATPPLDAKFTVFGAVTSGIGVAGLLTTQDKIISVTIAEK